MIANIFGPDLGIVVLVILVVLVGGSQLPKIARNVGIAGKEFRKAQQEAEEDAERERQSKAANGPPAAVAIPPAPPVSAPAPPPPSPPVAGAAQAPASAPQAAGGQPAGEGSITLTPAQLEALLRAREEQTRKEGTNN